MLRVLVALSLVACRDGHPPKKEPATDDPWANLTRRETAPAAPRKPPPPRPLSMEGAVDAPRALLATPLPGYADPKVGDWRAYTHVTAGELGTFHATAIAIVTAVTPTTVTIEFTGRLDETGEQRTDGADEIPRAFTVDHEIHRHHNWPASRVELTDDARTIDGHQFPCKKLAFSAEDDLMPGKDVRVEVWLSSSVPAGGEVAVREVQKTERLTITSTSELIGYGDATHTTWGRRPAGL